MNDKNMNVRKCTECGIIQNVKNDQEGCSECGANISDTIVVPSTIKNINEAQLTDLLGDVFDYIDNDREEYESYGF